MKNWIIIFAIFILSVEGNAQKFLTKNGHIKFHSETPVETIEAHNRQVNSALDISTGDFVFKVLIKSFDFEKALMQEHFNENYMESDKFPNAMFKGKVVNNPEVDFNKEGEYKANIEGEMTIHGVTKKVNETGTFTVKDGKIEGNSVILVKPEDYDISIPKTVMKKIAESLEVTINVSLEKFEK